MPLRLRKTSSLLKGYRAMQVAVNSAASACLPSVYKCVVCLACLCGQPCLHPKQQQSVVAVLDGSNAAHQLVRAVHTTVFIAEIQIWVKHPICQISLSPECRECPCLWTKPVGGVKGNRMRPPKKMLASRLPFTSPIDLSQLFFS